MNILVGRRRRRYQDETSLVARSRGFTLIELLIVIAVISILTSITVVAYSGIQQRAYELRVVTAAQNYMKAFIAYSTNDAPIGLQDGGVSICLGSAADYPAVDGWAAGQCERCEAPYTCGSSVAQHLDVEPLLGSITTGLSAANVKPFHWAEAGLHYRGIYLFNGYTNAKIEWIIGRPSANCGQAFDAYAEPIQDDTATLCTLYHTPPL